MKNTQITKTCQVCGSPFKVKAYRADTAHYCSKDCWSHRNPAQPRNCQHCGKLFNSRDKRATFCSRSCSRKSMTGEKATNWKGGASLFGKRAQAKGELAKWREAVYKRDNYTCQTCGKKGGDIHAHHIKPVAQYPELMLDTINGITLCATCHGKEHGKQIPTPRKYTRHCADCGSPTSGRSLYCRPCSIHRYHVRVGHKSTNSGITPVIS